MKIMHIGSNYLPNAGGNVDRMRSMIEKNSNFDEIFVLTLAKRREFDDNLYYKAHNIKIIRFSSHYKMFRKLRSIIKKYDIDVLITHLIIVNLFALLISPRKIKIYFEIHSFLESSRVRMFVKKQMFKWMFRFKNEGFFVLSVHAREYLKKSFSIKSDKIHFLPNGRINESLRIPNRIRKDFTLAYIGTFYTWQGCQVIADLMESIFMISNSIKVILIGDGEYYSRFKELSKVRYYDRLVVTGMLSHDEIEKYITDIDLLIVPRPSTLETETAIPLKIFDGYKYNRPVLFSSVGGLVEVLENDPIYVYDHRNPKSLLELIENVFNERSLLDSIRAKQVQIVEKWPKWSDVHNLQWRILNGKDN